jgi:RNA polymerase sigma factor (sigma-70 family)
MLLPQIETLATDEGMSSMELVELEFLRAELQRALGTLKDKESEVVGMRYGLKGGAFLTRPEIAEKLGLSSSNVYSLERSALAKLRQPKRLSALLTYA